MLLTFFDESALISLLPRFQTAVEVGVYRGENSERILAVCDRLWLVDPWLANCADRLPDHERTEESLRNLEEVFSNSYPGGYNVAVPNAFKEIVRKYGKDERVTIIRGTTSDLDEIPDRSVNLAVLDANYQFSYVLKDLLNLETKLAMDSCIFVHGFYRGIGSVHQHSGVVEACSQFLVRRGDFQPIVMGILEWGDAIFARGSLTPHLLEHFKKMIIANNQYPIEVPNSLIHGFHHRYVTSPRDNKVYAFPSFGK